MVLLFLFKLIRSQQNQALLAIFSAVTVVVSKLGITAIYTRKK